MLKKRGTEWHFLLGEEVKVSLTVACSLLTSRQCHKNPTGKFWKSRKGKVREGGLKGCHSIDMRHHPTKREYTNKH